MEAQKFVWQDSDRLRLAQSIQGLIARSKRNTLVLLEKLAADGDVGADGQDTSRKIADQVKMTRYLVGYHSGVSNPEPRLFDLPLPDVENDQDAVRARKFVRKTLTQPVKFVCENPRGKDQTAPVGVRTLPDGQVDFEINDDGSYVVRIQSGTLSTALCDSRLFETLLDAVKSGLKTAVTGKFSKDDGKYIATPKDGVLVIKPYPETGGK